ncbi:Centromere-associated protein E [Morus notabilis]|uniref:Centromere-associated protein E n=1 Tax=Morus notabilis TaxID=981085 RepID=W9S7V2_9ROSA|nr:Centromere-associated protein E [Morus notabilis]
MERIHVTLRTRPLSSEDANSSPWRISANSIFIPNHSSKFEFDRIFCEDSKTQAVYEARTKEIVAAAVQGRVLMTNSGKTYTMRGSATEPGVIPLAVRDLFDIIQQDVDREFLLRMSYMEIYNEEINDLLAPEHRKLQIHESIERGIYVAGLREEIVASPEQVLGLMEFGESHRHIGETNMNVHSSRSHTIFRMIIESRDKSEDEDLGSSCDAVRVSVLNLVDLAGSERAAKTGAEGVRLKEGSHINKSLMALGTVIKKLSEGAESQGGHVPYRDSKLTRILQPALGGNANTAIICNITLAQIHVDETKSSLQFASRALRVKNCAHVNEILTDAALLKRQKKEIEELRAKLQGSHSEHWEEEILNLRNTLLQTELERERIALELEEERKAQAEWEKMVQKQAKKIENLSSIVLCSNRDENRDRVRKLQDKRRDTWCAGNLSREIHGEVNSSMQYEASAIKPTRTKRDMGPLLPFEELMSSIPEEETCKQDEECQRNASEEYKLPDPCALLHITNRRKLPHKKKSSSTRIESEIKIDCLTRKLAEVGANKECSACCFNKVTINGDGNVDSNEPEANQVIKSLKEQIKMLELEKASSQQNLASDVEPETEQSMCVGSQEKFEEEENSAFVNKLFSEVQDVIFEVQDSKVVIESMTSILDEVSKTFSALIETFLDFKALMRQSNLQEKSIISNYEKLNSCLMQKVSNLENEKSLLHGQSVDLQNQIEELKLQAQNSENSLRTLLEEQDLEKEEYLSYIQSLEREISSFSSCSLAKEKETLRKDLEKTKLKLKDREFKLKNVMQEKTKLEGENAFAEREIKRLNGQNSLLERESFAGRRRESFAGRRRDSVIDNNSKMCDPKKSKGLIGSFDETIQEEYKKMEVYAFEMETKIASLEDQLLAVCREKEETFSRSEYLASELEVLSEKLNTSNSELNLLQEEVSGLRQRLEDSKLEQQQMETSIKLLVEEKEELAMQLSDSLLEMEEVKAIWAAKERASVQAIEEKAKLYNTEIASLSNEISEVRNELESRRQECEMLRERLTCSEEDLEKEKSRFGLLATLSSFSVCMEKFLGINQPKSDVDIEIKQSHEEVDMLQKDLSSLKKEREDLLIQIRELQTRSDLSNDFEDQVNSNKEMAKQRMRLRWTQKKLDAFRDRYAEMVKESDHMNKKYEEAAGKLKERLASKGIEVLNLKKQLLAANGQ